MVDQLVAVYGISRTSAALSSTITMPQSWDDTHLLVAIAYDNSTGTLQAYRNNTGVAGDAFTTIKKGQYGPSLRDQLAVWVSQGGSFTQIRFQHSSASQFRGVVLVFSGYSSLTPIKMDSQLDNGLAAGTSATIAHSSKPDGYGVTVACVGLHEANATSWGTWGNDYTPNTAASTAAPARLWTARHEYTGSPTPDTSISWTPSLASGTIIVSMPLVAPPPSFTESAALGDTAVTLAVGDAVMTGKIG